MPALLGSGLGIIISDANVAALTDVVSNSEESQTDAARSAEGHDLAAILAFSRTFLRRVAQLVRAPP